MRSLGTITTGQQSNPQNVSQPSKLWMSVEGTFSGGTVTMQYSNDGGTTWNTFTVDGAAVTWTSAELKLFHVPSGKYRVSAASTGSINVYAEDAPLES